MLATAVSPSVNNMVYQSPTQREDYVPTHLMEAQALVQSQEYMYPPQPQLYGHALHPSQAIYHPPTHEIPGSHMVSSAQLEGMRRRVDDPGMEYHRMHPAQPLYPSDYAPEQCYQPLSAVPNANYDFRFPAELASYDAHPYQPVYALADAYANNNAGPSDYRGWGEEEGDGHQDYADNGDVIYNPMEVKHRRRTTPEQFLVLEESFGQNPKPSNQHRKVLADMLGMTTRGVQVWFQNRRAKAKAALKKEREAQRKLTEDHVSDQNRPNSSSHGAHFTVARYQTGTEHQPPSEHAGSQQHLRPPSTQQGAAGRRVSNGALEPERRVCRDDDLMSSRKASQSALGTAAEARRGSLPYPSPLPAGPPRAAPPLGPVPSSPPTRHLPAHLVGTRPGRRASLPSGAMTVSSGPFTPPRVGNIHPLTSARIQPNGLGPGFGRVSPCGKRELSPIQDHEHSPDGSANAAKPDHPRELTVQTSLGCSRATLHTPVSSNYSQSTSPYDTVSPDAVNDFVQAQLAMSQGPLPNPTFSFGSAMPPPPEPFTPTEPRFAIDQTAPMYDFSKARFGSIASVGTNQTDAAENGSGSDWGMPADWMAQANLSQIFEDGTEDHITAMKPTRHMAVPQGFHPDARRASAPADLLHNFAYLGVDGAFPNGGPAPLYHAHRPSPLNQGFSADLEAHTKVIDSTSFSDVNGEGSSGPSPIGNHNSGVAAVPKSNVGRPQSSSQTCLFPVNSDVAPSLSPLSSNSTSQSIRQGS